MIEFLGDRRPPVAYWRSFNDAFSKAVRFTTPLSL